MGNEQMNFVVVNDEVKNFEKERKHILKERVSIYGVESLLNFEAISFLTGIKENEFKRFKTLQELKEGIDSLKATKLQKQKLKAFFTIAIRFSREKRGEVKRISSPSDVANLMNEMRYLKKEHFKVLVLDTKNNIISEEQVSVGTLNSSLVHPREVFKPAIQKSGCSVIICHNHPSGNPEPSREDINITKRLIEAGNLIGISVLDHVIIGEDRYFSLKEENLI